MAIWLATILGIGLFLSPGTTYKVDLVRVLDGDTFRAIVHDGIINTEARIRLRNIDAPELHARCADEYRGAVAARYELQRLLAVGSITIRDVGVDKYRGRIDATVSTRNTPDVSMALLRGGFARQYYGGHRGGWC
jgi:endonuclease YncB( thermonuclease family)